MIIEELLECSAAELKAMTDVQLKEHFKVFEQVTRPEFAAKPRATSSAQQPQLFYTGAKAAEMKAKAAKLVALGIDIDTNALLRRKK